MADWWENGTQVVTASWDRTVKLWDIEKNSVIHTLEGMTFLNNKLSSVFIFYFAKKYTFSKPISNKLSTVKLSLSRALFY